MHAFISVYTWSFHKVYHSTIWITYCIYGVITSVTSICLLYVTITWPSMIGHQPNLTKNQQLTCCISKINTTEIKCQTFYSTQTFSNVYESRKELKSASGVSARCCTFICTLRILLPVCLERYFNTIVSCLQRWDSESTDILITWFMTCF
jgi:hypothetical protein